jgi:hypothetical protein
MQRTLKRPNRWWYSIFWIGVIFSFSLTPDPADGLPGVFGTAAGVFAHAAEFLVLGVLVMSRYRWPHWVHPFLFGFIIALTDELIQSVVPGRDASVHDILVDFVGYVGGMAAAGHVPHLLRPLRIASVFAFLISTVRLAAIYFTI